MECAASDFRIFWDNAYAVHHFSDDPPEQDIVLDIAEACREAGNPDRYLKFGSTSKITFPGAGVAALAASPANIGEIKRHLGVQAIGHDKLNQLRHARFLEEGARLPEHMAAHGALMGPKFELVEKKLAEELAEPISPWTNPRGGYFVSTRGPLARRTASWSGEECRRHHDGAPRHLALRQRPADSTSVSHPRCRPWKSLTPPWMSSPAA